jgi:hypothetical protein
MIVIMMCTRNTNCRERRNVLKLRFIVQTKAIIVDNFLPGIYANYNSVQFSRAQPEMKYSINQDYAESYTIVIIVLF